jgi:hypothetical protein
MALTTHAIDDLMLQVTEEILVRASLEDTFDALLEQIGPANETPDGTLLAMKLEAWPGGRWFRDLGDGNGHFWGHVQAIKRPALLEIAGPLFMSAAVISNIQYRLTKTDGGTLIAFRHTALGLVPDEVRQGLTKGWKPLHERVRRAAETKRAHA